MIPPAAVSAEEALLLRMSYFQKGSGMVEENGKPASGPPAIRPIDMALYIIQNTHDGNDLAPEHLYMVQAACNGWLTEEGEVAFYELYASVMKGYVKPWYHGIEHMTKDHEGYIYWKGVEVEHYSFDDYEKADAAAKELAGRCRFLESKGIEPTCRRVIWEWKDDDDSGHEIQPKDAG
jgi:hypothetical protein